MTHTLSPTSRKALQLGLAPHINSNRRRSFAARLFKALTGMTIAPRRKPLSRPLGAVIETTCNKKTR